MSTVATLWVKLGLNSKDYGSGLANASKATREAGKKMMGIGAGLTAGLTLPIAGAGVAAVKFASDLEQSVGGVESVFKDAAEEIFNFGSTAAETVGLSEQRFNSLATIGGALLKNVGFPLQQATEETIKLTERAADMAATFGGPVESAMGAIQSALKGEFNPLEQFGVKMNQAAINARALSLGLVDVEVDMLAVRDANAKLTKAQETANKVLEESGSGSLEYSQALINIDKAQRKLEDTMAGTTGEISDSAKAQAALSILYEQTADTAGQFAREANTVAGQTERMKAKFENAAATLGKQLLPIGLKVIEFVSDLIDKFTALTPEQQKMILIVLGIVAAIGPLITIVGGIVTALGALAGFIAGPLFVPILALVGVIALLIDHFGGIEVVIEKVKALFAEIGGEIKRSMAAGLTPLETIGEVLDNFLPEDIMMKVWDFIIGLQNLREWLAVNIPVAIQALSDFWTNTLQPAIATVWAYIQENVIPLLIELGAWLSENIPVAIQTLSDFWTNTLQPAIEVVWKFLQEKAFPLFAAVADFLTSVFGYAFRVVAAFIENIFMPNFRILVDFFNEHILPVIQKVADWLGEKLKPAFEGISGAIDDLIGWLRDAADSFDNMSLPSWLTPGSPTPFELGLLGINDALKKVAAQGLPNLSTGLELSPVGAMSTPQIGGGGGSPEMGGGRSMVIFESGSVVINDTETGTAFKEKFENLVKGES